jgi:hypothetical protein
MIVRGILAALDIVLNPLRAAGIIFLMEIIDLEKLNFSSMKYINVINPN